MDEIHPPILLLAATHAEMAPANHLLNLAPNTPLATQTRSPTPPHTPHNTNTPIIRLVTGIGQTHAINATQNFCNKQKPVRIINIGFAGALDPSKKTGHLLNITHVIHSDGTTINIAPDKPTGDTLLTVDALIDTANKKQILFRQHHAHAIDMESFYLAQFATQNNIPITIIRAISDDAHTALPADATKWITPTGQTNTRAIAWSLLKNPRLATTLPALAHATTIASNAITKNLTQFLADQQSQT